jgi:outer membrane usher protein FimD/PapC
MTSGRVRSAAKLTAVLVALLAARPALCSSDPTALGGVNPLPPGYSLTYDRDKWGDEFSVFQLTAAEPFGLINSSIAASDDPRLKPLTRLDSSLSFSAPLIHLPTRVGDTVSSSAFWDQPVRIGGVQMGTLQPALPAVMMPAELLAPDILTNPGVASSTPVNTASNRFIDHINTVAQLQSQALALPGQGLYSLEMGRVREDFELRSNNYGSWLTSGTYRYGLNAATTLDGQFAQLKFQQSIFGVGVMEGLGPLGQFSARLANSRDGEGTGWLARLGYDFTRDNLTLAVRTHIQSAGYQTLGDLSAVEPMRQRTLASAGWDMGYFGRVSLASATQTYIDDSRRDVLALSHAMPLGNGGILSAAAAYSPGQLASSALLLSISYPFDYWMTPARRIGQDIDIGLERTISDALNQIRNPMSGHVMAGSGLQ